MDTVSPAIPAVVAGASVAGASHARAELPCQDAFAVAALADGVAIAVADGLGSAALADRGARIAVDAAIGAASGGVEAMLERARAALEEEARAAEIPLADLACTLIAVVCSDGVATCAHVGDGAAVVQANDELILLSGPDHGEYVNVVEPLTADDWPALVRKADPIKGVRALAVLTDGCERAALSSGGPPHAKFFQPLFAFVARGEPSTTDQLEALLSGEKMSEHSDDDKTLVIAWLSPPS